MKKGDKVEFIDKAIHQRYPAQFPKPGTIGEIVAIDVDGDFWIQWPSGSTSGDDLWCSCPSRVKAAHT